MIIKVQLSLAASTDEQQVLIYDEHRNFWWEGPATSEVKAAMGDDTKAFFEAKMAGTEMQIGKRVIDQVW